MGGTTLHGIGVTGDIVVAPVFVMLEVELGQRTGAGPDAEDAALREAISTSVAALEQLAATVEGEAAEILEFQAVLLDDEDMLEPVWRAIAAGASADDAWRTIMDHEIAEYAEGEDEVFRARAADLRDLRDRVLRALHASEEGADRPTEPSILVASDLPPSVFLEIDPALVSGVALGEGSRTSHVALLARARGVPMVVGMGALPDDIARHTGASGVLDPEAETMTIGPDPGALDAARERMAAAADLAARASFLTDRPALTAGGMPVTVLINVDHPSIVDDLDPAICDGIGLVRTEFLFERGAPGEDSQYESYRKLVLWADGRPVTLRTLDAGGDKPIPGITLDGETNPFLGVRGLRLSMRLEEIFDTQLRAMARVAALGPVKIMVPMVTAPDEIAPVRTRLEAVIADLAARGVDHGHPQLGMMVEVPAAALSAELFDVDFYSIGTNDLIQYATACARDNRDVAALARGDHPGVLRMIDAVAQAGVERGVEVSVCGDMASDPEGVDRLLASGVRVLSAAPAQVGRVKVRIAESKISDGDG